MLFKVEVLIEANDEAQADLARDELTNAAQDAEDEGECPRGTFSVGELKVAER